MLDDGIVLTYCFFPQQQNTRGTPLYYSIYVFPYFEMWHNDTKPSTFRVFSLTWPVSMQDKAIETTTTKTNIYVPKESTPTAFVWNTNMAAARHVKPLSSAEAPARYPYKNSNNRKNRKRAGSDGKREKARSVFLSPQPPQNTMIPLRRKEMWNHEIRLSICLFVSIAPSAR